MRRFLLVEIWQPTGTPDFISPVIKFTPVASNDVGVELGEYNGADFWYVGHAPVATQAEVEAL